MVFRWSPHREVTINNTYTFCLLLTRKDALEHEFYDDVYDCVQFNNNNNNIECVNWKPVFVFYFRSSKYSNSPCCSVLLCDGEVLKNISRTVELLDGEN